MTYSRINRFVITDEFWNWIKPLLYSPEDIILKEHIEMTTNGFRLIQPKFIMRQYNLTRKQVREIRAKLEGLAILYELEVAAFQ